MKVSGLRALFLFLCFTACLPQQPEKKQVSTPQEPTKAALKAQLLDKLTLFTKMSKLKSTLYQADMTAREVMEFCRQNVDMVVSAKLIQAVFSDNEYEEESPKKEYWAAHRLHVGKFVEIVSILREGRTHFLDIGSGNGEKLFGALCLGFKKAFGIEYNPKSCQDSQLNLQNFKAETEVTCADALTIHVSHFKKADFIYMYSPIKDDNLMASLFKRIMDNLEEDAVLLEVRFVYAEALNRLTSYKFPNVRGWIAIKKSMGKFYYKNIAENAYGYDLLDGRAWFPL